MTAALAVMGTTAVNAQLLITQYYEGTSNNKWIEIKNVGNVSFDLSTVTVGNWNNANSEGYKTSAGPSFTLALSGALAAGSVFTIANQSSVLPFAASSANLSTSSAVMGFNGNDSIGLYLGATFNTANLLDVIGFTETGNEGADKSFVRLNGNKGWNTTAGSDVLDFGSVWANTTLATVNAANSGTNDYIGFSAVVAVPEPTSAVLLMGGIGSLFWRLRRRRVMV